jgi:hypothetical protein
MKTIFTWKIRHIINTIGQYHIRKIIYNRKNWKQCENEDAVSMLASPKPIPQLFRDGFW